MCYKVDEYLTDHWTPEESVNLRFWFSIDRYVETGTGELDCISYYVFNGEVMYFCDYSSTFDSMRPGDLNVPVPFKPGDMIVCDGRPISEEIAMLIIRIGDNWDCCSLVGVCERDDGTFSTEPVKHSNMFYDSDAAVYIPPLYRARYASEEEWGSRRF